MHVVAVITTTIYFLAPHLVERAQEASEEGTVTLTHTLAQRIVDWLAISFDLCASVADPSARIIASTEPELVGTTHPSAHCAIARGGLSAGGDIQHTGIVLPIVSANTHIGAIVLND